MGDDPISIITNDLADVGGTGNADTSAPGNAPQDGQAAATNPDPATSPEQNQQAPDGTAKAEEKPASPPAKEAPKGIRPELEPFKTLLDSRKWDPEAPDFAPKVLKSYEEIEQFASRAKGEVQNTQTKAQKFQAALEGGVDAINKYRESRGLPPIPADARSYEDRAKSVDEMVEHIDRAMKGDGSSIDWLNNHFAKERQDLAINRALAQRNPGKSADDAFRERKTQAQANFAEALSADPQAKAFFDELTDHLSPGGVFDGLGIDVLDAAATPARLAAFLQIGQALHAMKNMDKIVDEKVKAELERRRGAAITGPAGTTGANAQANEEEDPLDAVVAYANGRHR